MIMMIGGAPSFLLLFMLPITVLSAAFEVPYPQTSAQIRSSIVASDASFASPPPPPPPQNKNDENQPITRQILLGSGTMAEVITCIPTKKTTSPDMLEHIFSSSSSNKKKP